MPKELTTVTKTSKILALIMFVALPLIAFLMGRNYQAQMDLYQSQQNQVYIPPISYPTPSPERTPPETGSRTVCRTNSDCWCRSFNGAKFIPNTKVQSICNLKTNTCQTCFYD